MTFSVVGILYCKITSTFCVVLTTQPFDECCKRQKNPLCSYDGKDQKTDNEKMKAAIIAQIISKPEENFQEVTKGLSTR
jgi:hypothetical protein